MSSLADFIEAYLKQQLQSAAQGMIEIQRRQLAEQFRCVPSQINYVLTTRFSPEKGYIIESRRGGGGFIRISRLEWRAPADLLQELETHIGGQIQEETALALLDRLEKMGLLTPRRAALLRFSLTRETQKFDYAVQDRVRALLLKNMLLVLFQK